MTLRLEKDCDNSQIQQIFWGFLSEKDAFLFFHSIVWNNNSRVKINQFFLALKVPKITVFIILSPVTSRSIK